LYNWNDLWTFPNVRILKVYFLKVNAEFIVVKKKKIRQNIITKKGGKLT
jgi:hypothetical protein